MVDTAETEARTLLDYPSVWLVIREGALSCCCCDRHCGDFGSAVASCGRHAYCILCRQQGLDKDHECGDLPDSVPFRRLDHDCPGCGKRHQDWERCAAEVWRRLQVMKAEGRDCRAGSEPWVKEGYPEGR